MYLGICVDIHIYIYIHIHIYKYIYRARIDTVWADNVEKLKNRWNPNRLRGTYMYIFRYLLKAIYIEIFTC
jgi:hypothetical protein